MKKLIIIFFLYSSSIYATDYRQEIDEHVITPCFKQVMINKGLDPNSQILFDKYIQQFEGRVTAITDFMQDFLNLYQPSMSDSDRQDLYQIALDSCLGGLE